jgi:hypothetical protein
MSGKIYQFPIHSWDYKKNPGPGCALRCCPGYEVNIVQGGSRLDLDATIVFWTDPIHPARHATIFHDFCGYHWAAALRTLMCVRFTLVSEAGARRLGNLFSHLGNSSFSLISAHKNCESYRSTMPESIVFFCNLKNQSNLMAVPVRASSR